MGQPFQTWRRPHAVWGSTPEGKDCFLLNTQLYLFKTDVNEFKSYNNTAFISHSKKLKRTFKMRIRESGALFLFLFTFLSPL